MSLLEIRRDEVTKIALTWAMCALLAIGYAIGWSAVHSMLVKRMGVEYLPYTYIGISLLGVLGSSVYLSFADAVRRDRLLVWFCGLTGLALLGARTLVSARPDGETGVTASLVLFFAAVFFAQGVGNATLGTQVWTIINDLVRPSQGRRLYPILGTAGTVGGIAGGASIHFLAQALGTANLVVLWALAIWAIIPLTWLVRAKFGGELRGLRPAEAARSAHRDRLGQGWAFFRSSKMARTLGVVAVLFWVVGSVADFQYTRIMNATFPDESSLAGYYGIYGMVINASGLLVQVFFSGYLIRRIGVGRGLVALPATVLGGFCLIAASFSFWSGLLMRYAWDMVGMTVQGNSYQLSLNAIPTALRGRVRGIIDGVINPLGGVLGGMLILVLHALFDSRKGSGWDDPVTVSGLVLAGLWLFLVAGAQRNYLGILEQNLAACDKRTVLDAIESLEEPGSAKAAILLEKAASSGDGEVRANVARTRGGSRDRYALDGLRASCDDPMSSVRKASVQALARFSGGVPAGARPDVERLLECDPDPRVRAAALKALLAGSSPAGSRQLAERWLSHPDSAIRARAVEAVGRSDWDFVPLLAPLLDDPVPLVRAHAARELRGNASTRERAKIVLGEVLEDAQAGVEAHEVALATCHVDEVSRGMPVPGHLLRSADPAVRVLALALGLGGGVGEREALLAGIFQALGEPANLDRLRAGLLPHLPDFSEQVADAILMASASLDPSRRQNVGAVLAEWHRAMEIKMEPPE